MGRHLRLMGRSGPLDGTASSEGGYADQVSLGFLTNVSRASNPAGPIAADAGMLAVPTRHLRRRPGSRPRPQRHPLTLAVRRLPAGTGWMSRFGQVGSPASVYPRGHVQGEDLALVDHLVERREPARDGGRRTRRRRRVRGRAGLLYPVPTLFVLDNSSTLPPSNAVADGCDGHSFVTAPHDLVSGGRVVRSVLVAAEDGEQEDCGGEMVRGAAGRVLRHSRSGNATRCR